MKQTKKFKVICCNKCGKPEPYGTVCDCVLTHPSNKSVKGMPTKFMRVTPCCKSRKWHAVYSANIPDGTVRCELCDNMFDQEDFVKVAKGLNPVTFFCDMCHTSAETELQRSNEDKKDLKKRLNSIVPHDSDCASPWFGRSRCSCLHKVAVEQIMQLIEEERDKGQEWYSQQIRLAAKEGERLRGERLKNGVK